MTIALEALREVGADVLTGRLYELRRNERLMLVEFLTVLGELDRRNAVVGLGFSSVFDFLHRHLGYSKAASFRRKEAAILLGRFPVVGECLADGRLCLTTLVELRDVLTEENLGQVLDRAAGRTEDEVKLLVASLAPKPAPPELFRRLPTKTSPSSGPELTPSSGPELTPVALLSRPARLEPINAEQRVLRVTVGQEVADDLQAVKYLLSHQLPGASLERVLAYSLALTREVLEKRRRGTGLPMRKAATPASRYVPAAIRDEVFRRDNGRCTFVAKGRPCGSTHLLQLHHKIPYAKGGPTVASNLTLHCAQHNAYQAERDFPTLPGLSAPSSGPEPRGRSLPPSPSG